MGWIRRNAGDLRARRARRPVSVLLTAAGAVVLAAACVACGTATVSSPTITTSGAGGSGSATSGAAGSGSATSSGGGGSARSCSTKGVGGDTRAPLPCASPASSSGRGISPLPTLPTTAPPVSPAVALPQVTAISPASGSAGSGFTGATAVDFGGVSAQMAVGSDTKITATSPPGNGTVDVTVMTPVGTSATSPADQFSYQSEQPT
jgi:hypothetical protein